MKMYVGPAETKYTPVANDPDQARLVTNGEADAAVPHIVYVRRGQLVQLSIRGAIFAGATGAQRTAALADWNRKLLALPRMP